MRIQAYCDNTWLYPDSILGDYSAALTLHAARGGTAAFQALSDTYFDAETPVSVVLEAPAGVSCVPYQLIACHVEENSGPDTHTTLDYPLVADFVTRRAPFDVYDATRDLDTGLLLPGRGAFYFLLRVDETCSPGPAACSLYVRAGEEAFTLELTLHIHRAVVPPLAEASFGMVNWLFPEHVAERHGVERGGSAFWDLIQTYLDNQLDARTNHLMLPRGEAVLKGGRVVDFDFTEAEILGNMALEAGFAYIYGGFVARFQRWDDPLQYLLWDRETDTSGEEGYRQLKLYFTKLWQLVCKNRWQERYMQCLVDEPQFPNSESYRSLSGICRRFMPGVKIHDPVETYTIPGAVDIWCVKQAVYEKHLAAFRRLQAMGEEMWVYTCGFPAGKMMNRATDLPLLAGRLPMWLCWKYGLTGFLHWGYNAYTGDPFRENCFAAGERRLPPGDGFIVYPGDGRPWNSVRAHLQRAGAEEYELLRQLAQKDEAAALALIARVCEGFDDYNADPANFAEVRQGLLRALDA